ncbi:hypothetical protein TRICI_006635 [Trichomonascus ciferrii]|uniref:F-box domain-containing protein n=1 Tax=Trichomonascus ciferrii TaxID=44093 RepID=A0A642ULY4_9ASCO|nr:hypothetical protein TRICI_006635 [Trichomonascus ciferrii]
MSMVANTGILDLPLEVLPILREYAGVDFLKLRATCKVFDTVVRDSLECWLEFSNQLDEELEYDSEDDKIDDFEYNSEEEGNRWLEYNEERLRVKFTSSYGHETMFLGEEFCSRIDSGGARFWLEQVTAIGFNFSEGKVYEECCEILRKIVGEFKFCLKELKVVSYWVDGEVYSGLSGIMERVRGDSGLVRERLFSYYLTDTKAVLVGNRVSELLINELGPSPKYIFAELDMNISANSRFPTYPGTQSRMFCDR